MLAADCDVQSSPFCFDDTATCVVYALSLSDSLPMSVNGVSCCPDFGTKIQAEVDVVSCWLDFGTKIRAEVDGVSCWPDFGTKILAEVDGVSC